MAKINHNNFVDTVNDMLNQAKEKEVMHLNFTDDTWSGNNMLIGEKDMVNFGTCGYLGLETHDKLIERSVEFSLRYGTQFSISRAFVTSNQNRILEDRLSEIFDGCKTVVFSSTTLAHMAVLPIVMSPEDAILIDQQAHLSMQTAAQLMVAKGVAIELIRHNNLDMLERKIVSLRDKHKKIWHVIDGVYSMYGDLPPYDGLNELAEKYPQLHFYVDDAHGMSWNGSKGSGCAFEQLKKNGRTILVSTMAKGFGSTGGIVVFPDQASYEKVQIYGGPLSYSHPLAPSVMGASLASADIHLSDDIVRLQKNLSERMELCNTLLEQTDIPILSNPGTPIYFLGTGQPNVGFNLNKRILDEGFYVNIGIFPAVSIKNTGLRFTITNHVSLEDIHNFVAALDYHYEKALEEEGRTNNSVRKAFKLPLLEEEHQAKIVEPQELTLEIYDSITQVDRKVWDEIMKSKSGCMHENMLMAEKAYAGNERKEENAQFFYYLVRNPQNQKIVAGTVFSKIIFKDDMFSSALKSMAIEEKRKEEPYYLTSDTFFMGSMLSEGDHLYVDFEEDWKKALQMILDHLYLEQDKLGVNNIILRDFTVGQEELDKFFYDMGFAKIDMPNSNVVFDLDMSSEDSFTAMLSKSSKKNFKRFIKKYEDRFEVSFEKHLSEEHLALFVEMHENIRLKNYAVNLFKYPQKVFDEMNSSEHWEFIVLKDSATGEIISIGSAYQHSDSYLPLLLGLSYDDTREEKVYHQMLYQAVKRAAQLGCTKVRLGLSADEAKKDVGARQIPKKAYLQSKDNYNFEIIETIVLG